MGAMVDALVSACLAKLGALMEEEVVRTLAVRKDIKRLRKKLLYFSFVRENAEAQALVDSGAEASYRDLKHLMYDIEDIIDLAMVKSRIQASSPSSSVSVCCNCTLFSRFSELPFDHKIARRIKDVNEQLDEMKKNIEIISSHRSSQSSRITSVDRSQTSPINDPDFVGEGMKQAVATMVQRIVSDLHGCRPHVLGIHGMGGIGKTTLAQKIYNEHTIKGKFDVRIWVCVSPSYTETGLLKYVIRMAGGKCDQLEMKAELLEVLRNSIRGKRVFLVLDDVYKPDVWNNLLRLPMECTLSSSCILVTTRYIDVLERMHAIYYHEVNKMNICDGLELLLRKSSRSTDITSEFTEIGEQIVKKCDGLPLAIEVIAGVLSSKKSMAEWESIRDSKWSTRGLPEEVHSSLFLSYNDLHPQLKQCFLWCALLPPNFDICRDDVAYWWVAEGFVSEEHGRSIYQVAEEYYLELIRRNLLQPKPDFFDKGVSRMHDLIRSLAQYLTRDHTLFLSKDVDMHMVRDHGFFKSTEQKEDELLKLRRLGISNDVEEIPAIENEIGLRSLLLFHSYNLREHKISILTSLKHLRVIVFRGIAIKRIPDSIGNLEQLRLLDLSYTKVQQLPESIGKLFSLEYFSVVGCLELGSLPAGLMGLSRLRFLQVDKALTSIPRGIGNFQHLYNLKGVFENGTVGFTLDELQNLSKIRHLWIERLEKAMHRSTMILSSMVHLKELGLCCTMDADPHNRTHYQKEQVERIQQVHDNLVPSRKLEYIFFYGFPGVSLPGWLCSEPQDKLPHLGHMHFNECTAFSELPPAGQLPELQVLHVRPVSMQVSWTQLPRVTHHLKMFETVMKHPSLNA
ncbi:unnamed protein product [Urochloa decumbens]|uniref:Uncharacterized protein n=1 Tax=Urochloa decumbens TaxID=240449 RepID=A0ABC8ZDF4_9POAL